MYHPLAFELEEAGMSRLLRCCWEYGLFDGLRCVRNASCTTTLHYISFRASLGRSGQRRESAGSYPLKAPASSS
jgi:hypothetical protein